MTITFNASGIFDEQGYTFNGDLIGTSKSDSGVSPDVVVRKASDVWRTK